MTKNLVSIIVAVYNAEGLISRCLDSLLCQTYRDIEIIVINDASTDGTQKVLEEYAKKDTRIILLQMEKNSGCPAARNKGMKVSKGEFLTMVDADDLIDPDTIELSVKELQADKELDLITFDMVIVDLQSGEKKPYPTNPKVPKVMNGNEACYWSIMYDYAPNGMSRSPLEQNVMSCEDYKYHSDETATHLALLNARKVKLGKGKYYYFMMPDSMTHKVTILRFDILESRNILKKQMILNGADRRIIRRIDLKRWREFIGICYFYWLHKSKFTKEEQRQISERLSKTYDTFLFSDLPLSTSLKPRFIMLPSFKLFYLQLSLVFKLNLVHIE